jgi:hypothetical protein
MPLWWYSVRNRCRAKIDQQLPLPPVSEGVGRFVRHWSDDSDGFVSIRCGGRIIKGMGIFSRQAAMFLRAMRFADPQTQ